MIELDLIPPDCSPHKIRHSLAITLVEDGVDLIAIRDLMSHTSVQTAEIYAKMSAAKSRSVIEATSKEIVPRKKHYGKPIISYSIKDWLKGMTKKRIMQR